MTPEQAAALRKPFDAKVVGKLPKSTCRECTRSQRKRCDQHRWVSGCPDCHGSHTSACIHLDYVGHAATTDRLLAVDPLWSWEPMALDEIGLPALDRGNNLWIKLTIAGVTRIGVGDGSSAKECIGDAIRNAAMRFGVALDLWSKEELEQAEGPAAPVESSAAPVAETPRGLGDVDAQTTGQPQAMRADTGASEPVLLNTSSALAKSMYAGINEAIEAGQIGKDDRIPFTCMAIGRAITSTKELTEDEARRVLNELDRVKAATS